MIRQTSNKKLLWVYSTNVQTEPLKPVEVPTRYYRLVTIEYEVYNLNKLKKFGGLRLLGGFPATNRDLFSTNGIQQLNEPFYDDET